MILYKMVTILVSEKLANFDPYNHHPNAQAPALIGPNGGPPQQQQPQGPGAYHEYPHSPPTPPSPSERSASPPPQHREPGKTLRSF